ncbi:MAG: decarboxylating NADP(+)-dependent phosphogluconate dehydrogenase [Candidatus Omnitrophota bacterium]
MGQQFGVIGLAVMGENIALNIERNGIPAAVYNRTGAKTKAFMEGRAAGKNFQAAYTLKEFVGALERPRKILVMVKAGAGVDAVLHEIKPLLEDGDILIDGGNSYFRDTDRRGDLFKNTGVYYMGMGISGGEEGALWGPSIMPGGARKAYEILEPILKKISAQTDSGPCVEYIGEGSAGHFVKMCHNGIEYGDMQLIAEVYDIMRHGLRLTSKEIASIFKEWNEGELQSFLIEITAKIADFPDDLESEGVLIDRILDSAGQKGTGKWTSLTAIELGVPVPTIAASVDSRILSSMKEERERAARVYPSPKIPSPTDLDAAVMNIRAALYASKICSYAQGFALMRAASQEFGYGLNYGDIARIWKGGCIIRAVFLDRIREAYKRDPDLCNLLISPSFSDDILNRIDGWRWTVSNAAQHGLAVPAMSASLAYFDSYRRERLPANLIQAQRDYFGAHTYHRTDSEGIFHTHWFGEK